MVAMRSAFLRAEVVLDVQLHVLVPEGVEVGLAVLVRVKVARAIPMRRFEQRTSAKNATPALSECPPPGP